MKKLELKYDQILFLYAYLRQLDLSLDRSRWTIWNEFQNYHKSNIQPLQVIEYLNDYFDLPITDLDHFVFFIKKANWIERLKSNVTKSFYLTENEMLYCCKILSKFNYYINSEIQEYNLNLEKLRGDISKYYSEILELMISKKDLGKLMRIEHYNSNTQIETININEFLPYSFKLIDTNNIE